MASIDSPVKQVANCFGFASLACVLVQSCTHVTYSCACTLHFMFTVHDMLISVVFYDIKWYRN